MKIRTMTTLCLGLVGLGACAMPAIGQSVNPDLYRSQEVMPSLLPKVRIEIGVNGAFVQTAADAIIKGAKHNGGEIGDGKIFVLPLDDCIRIRTDESGGSAI